MRSFTKAFLMLLLCMFSVLTTQAKTEKVHATFEAPTNTNTTWTAGTKTFTWSTTYYNQLKNIGLPSGDITKYKKLVVDCEIKSGNQFRILFYKGGSNLTLYASNGVNEFILADTLKSVSPNDYNEYLLACDEICLSGNNNAAPGEAVINDVYLETYDDEGEKVYATFEAPTNTNTTWTAGTKTFTWSTTYYNQLKNIGLPSGDITKYKKLVVDCEIKSGNQFRILFYKGGSNLTLYASNGVNEFILADTLKSVSPNDYNEYLLACDEICLSGNNNAAPGEAVINSVYLETYPENESVEIPEIKYEEDPGKPAGEFVDFTEVFSTLQPRIGLGTDGHPIVLGNGEVIVGQRTKDVIADLSAYSKLTMVTSPNLKLVVYMNHEVDAQQNAGDYAPADSGKYVFLNVQANENGIAEVDLTQFAKQDLNCICLPWDNNNKGTVWYLLLTAKAAVDPDADTLPIDIQFGSTYNDKSVQDYTSTWTATKDGKTWTLVNFNNNQNKWNSVKCGRKDYTSVASIASPAINAAVKSYVITLDAVSNVNTAKLAIMNGENLVGDSIDITEKFVAGEVVVPVEGQKGYSYVLTIDNKSGKNGSVEISRILLAGATVEPVEPVHIANTAETAYTIAKAIELIDAGEALNDSVFVKGIVSQVDEYNDQYKNINYWISDDGTTQSAQFECFRGKGINGADFAAISDIEVGAEVIVKGILTKYNATYEFKQYNELVSYKAPFHAPIADGKYYLYNVGAEGFIVGGNNWGTRASISKIGGIEFEAVMSDCKYELKSAPLYTGKHLGFDGYVDNDKAANWTIVPVEGQEGVFTLSTDGTNVLFWDGGEATTTTVGAMPETAANAHWKFISAEDRLASLASATAENPVDATFLIQNPNFSRAASTAAWTMEASNKNLSGGANENMCAESYHSVFTLSQTLSNAPAGKYKMTAQGFYRQDGSDNENLPVFYANDKTGTFPLKTGSENNMADASASFTAGQYTIEPIEVTVFEDGQLTVGAKLATNTSLWCIFDNFRLTYLTGEIPAEEFQPAYAAALKAAQDALAAEANAVITGEERTVFSQIIEKYTTVAENIDSMKAAIAALSAATTAFTSVKSSYDALATAKTTWAAFDFTPYKYVSAAKKQAAEATLTGEAATSAADATAKADAIYKAFRTAVESNAMLEDLEGTVNYTDSLAGANADQNTGWASGSIGTNQGQGYTDGNGDVCGKYLDGGWSSNAGANINLVRTLSLPRGKYILSVTARGSAALTEYTMSMGGQTITLPHNGADANTGVFSNGWDDAFLVFNSAGKYNTDTLQIIVKSEAAQQWVSLNRFRLVKFPATEEEIALDKAIDALIAIINADKTIVTEGQKGAEELANAIATAETAAKAADATIESIAAARAALASAVATFTKANLDADLIEIAQSQGKDLDTFTRTDLVEGAGYNTYTANGDLNIAIKMVNVDVKDCDYVVIKFAEPVAAGWHLAFWSNQDLVDVPEGATEFAYVFANDPNCGVSAEGVLPQICMMTFFGGFQAPLVAKIEGIYKHQIPVEIAHTWDFTKWSEETVANLKADAAASKLEGWSDVEKKTDAEADADPAEASKDNCFWATIAEGGELKANDVVIEELKGLQFGATFAGNRSLAIAVNYASTSLGEYHGASYLWLGGKNFECFTIPAVKGGTTIKMGVESHKPAEARGVQLFAGETELKDADDNAVAAPKTYTEQSWVVPAGVAFDIVVKNTNGCHIYFIDAEQDEATLTAISTLKSNDRLNGTIYNLNGQKMNKAQRGLYIINGKKVVIK